MGDPMSGAVWSTGSNRMGNLRSGRHPKIQWNAINTLQNNLVWFLSTPSPTLTPYRRHKHSAYPFSLPLPLSAARCPHNCITSLHAHIPCLSNIFIQIYSFSGSELFVATLRNTLFSFPYYILYERKFVLNPYLMTIKLFFFTLLCSLYSSQSRTFFSHPISLASSVPHQSWNF